MAKFGLIGYPLEHSFSKKFFSEKFGSEGLNHQYLNFEMDSLSEFKIWKSSFSDLCGLNVTMPFKTEIIRYLDFTDNLVHKTNSCNTILIEKDYTFGYNTDIYGFYQSIKDYNLHKGDIACILGSGGASKSVQHVFAKLGLKYYIISRRKGHGLLTYDEIGDSFLQTAKIIVNTTPLGQYPHYIDQTPELPYKTLTNQHICVDLVYNPSKTKFLKICESYGAEIQNGITMLEQQAKASWRIWNSTLY